MYGNQKNGYKIIRIISPKDYLPDNNKLLELINTHKNKLINSDIDIIKITLINKYSDIIIEEVIY